MFPRTPATKNSLSGFLGRTWVHFHLQTFQVSVSYFTQKNIFQPCPYSEIMFPTWSQKGTYGETIDSKRKIIEIINFPCWT